MNVGKIPKPDAIDAERLRAMLDSEPFRLITVRVKSELERALGTCERSAEPVELHRAQGAIAALRTVLAIPDLILKEIAKNG